MNLYLKENESRNILIELAIKTYALRLAHAHVNIELCCETPEKAQIYLKKLTEWEKIFEEETANGLYERSDEVNLKKTLNKHN